MNNPRKPHRPSSSEKRAGLRAASLLLAALTVLACSATGIVPSSDGGTQPAPTANPTPTGAEGGTSSNDCLPSLRRFNGECRTVCTKRSDCAAGLACISVDDEESICLPYADCGYLGSDTQCVAYGGSYAYSRGGMSTFTPYQSTPGADPSDVTSEVDPYFEPQPYSASVGPCQGNAKWITKPIEGEVGCAEEHVVKRCRFNYAQRRCELGTGTTREFVQP